MYNYQVCTDMGTGNSRGFGFVALDGEEAGMKACTAMDGADLDGRVRASRLGIGPRDVRCARR